MRKPKKITVKQLTTEVRKTINTPFRHAGRVIGPNGGLDCGGIIIVALKALGIPVEDKDHYDRRDGLNDMVEILTKNNFYTISLPEKTSETKFQGGDIVLIRGLRMLHHLVYYTEDNTIIHAWFTTGVNRVVETTMLPEWLENIHSVWRYKWLR